MQLFISHSSKDSDFVDQIKKRIESAGAEAYLAQYDRSGVGHKLDDKLMRAIATSNAVVILLTENAASTTMVHDEIGYALGLSKHVIPLVTPEVARDSTALGLLNGLEYIPFDRQNYEQGLIQLTDVVNDLVKAEREEYHRAEVAALSMQVLERDQALAQLQSRIDTIQSLLIFATAVTVVVMVSRSSG